MKNTKSIFMLPAFILAAVFSVNFISKDYTNAEWPVHITDNSDKAPEIKAEKWINSDNVKANVKELGIEYPMATDNAFYNWYNYDVHA